jgi:hypothetical protein
MAGCSLFRSFSSVLVVVMAVSELDEAARHGCTRFAVQRL